MRVRIPSPEYTPRSSGEWTAAELAAGPRSVAEGVPSLFGRVEERLQAHNLAGGLPGSIDYSLPQQTLLQPAWSQSWDNNDLNDELQMELTHATLSATPAVMGQLGLQHIDMHRILGDQIHSPQLKDGSLPAYFVMYCLYWLVCSGQDDVAFQANGERYLNSALTAFLCMLTNAYAPAEECLGALSVVAVLFDCYAQHERLHELLLRCDELTKKHYNEDNPLTRTIEFMGNMLAGPKCPPHNIPRLAQIVEDMRVIFPQSLRPALTARYHLAWAMLENELKKGGKGSEAFEPVRQYLEDLTTQCELHFGPDRIETIMAAATLARATFNCEDGIGAEHILSQSVMPRVRRNFVESHPYVWEAKHRHAYFLYQLAVREDDASKFARLQLCEHLLRQIVPARCRILGESNPKSRNSFQLLKDTLKAQGRDYEAGTLSEWCQRELRQPVPH
jgi:hypothetical protein